MIYISDLDGTLLNDAAQISEFSKKELNRLIDNGLLFTVASARSVVSMNKILDGLNLKLPVIEFNGAFITDFNDGKHLMINNIDSCLIADLLNICRKHDNEPFLSTFNGVEDKLYYEKLNNDGMKWYVEDRKRHNDRRLMEAADLSDHSNEKTVCFTIINRKEKLSDLFHEIKNKYGEKLEILLMENAYSPGWFWLTLHDSNATKDKAIIELLKTHHLNLQDLVVFGNDVNDISMFNLSKNSIAVENANDELKMNASQVIGNNNDDSVVKYIINDYEKRSGK